MATPRSDLRIAFPRKMLAWACQVATVRCRKTNAMFHISCIKYLHPPIIVENGLTADVRDRYTLLVCKKANHSAFHANILLLKVIQLYK